jgi:hypothetical protein
VNTVKRKHEHKNWSNWLKLVVMALKRRKEEVQRILQLSVRSPSFIKWSNEGAALTEAVVQTSQPTFGIEIERTKQKWLVTSIHCWRHVAR